MLCVLLWAVGKISVNVKSPPTRGFPTPRAQTCVHRSQLRSHTHVSIQSQHLRVQTPSPRTPPIRSRVTILSITPKPLPPQFKPAPISDRGDGSRCGLASTESLETLKNISRHHNLLPGLAPEVCSKSLGSPLRTKTKFPMLLLNSFHSHHSPLSNCRTLPER